MRDDVVILGDTVRAVEGYVRVLSRLARTRPSVAPRLARARAELRWLRALLRGATLDSQRVRR